jgi:hypothetical protein
MADKRSDDEWKRLFAQIVAEVAAEVLIEVGPPIAEEAGRQGRRFAERLRERTQAASEKVNKRLRALRWPSRSGDEGRELFTGSATSLDDFCEQLNKRLDTIEAKVDELRQGARPSGPSRESGPSRAWWSRAWRAWWPSSGESGPR